MTKTRIIISILITCNAVCLLLLILKNKEILNCNNKRIGLEQINNQYAEYVSNLNYLHFIMGKENFNLDTIVVHINDKLVSLDSLIATIVLF